MENVVRSQEIKVFTRTMRQLICQMDAWDGLTMEDIRRMEDEAKSKLDEIALSYSLPVLARLPIDPKIAELCDAGQMEQADVEKLLPAATLIEKA